MAFANPVAYVNSVGYAAVAAWAASTAYTVGQIRRQLATPAAGSERCFVCIIAGTSLASEPTWVTTVGAKTAEAAGPTWMECTGQPAVNGDSTNSPPFIASRAYALGESLIDSNNRAQICTTAGTSAGSAPTWATTTGTTTTSNTAVFTCLGTVASFQVNGFAAPHIRLQNANTASWQPVYPSSANGNVGYAGLAVMFVSSSHAYSVAATYSPNYGSASLTITIRCVVDSAFPPVTPATGASESTTGANTLTINGYVDSDGVNYSSGSGAVNNPLTLATVAGFVRISNCILSKLGTVSTGGAFFLGNSVAAIIELVNVGMAFGSTVDSIGVRANIRWFNSSSNPAISGATVPTVLIGSYGTPSLMEMRGLDLSAITGTLVLVSAANAGAGVIIFDSCKIASGVVITSGISSVGPASNDVRLINCDDTSGNSIDRYIKSNGMTGSGGLTQTEYTVVKTGGSNNGSNAFSRKIVTGTLASRVNPFVMDPIAIWIDSTGSPITPLISILNDGIVLKNNEIWCEVEYLGASTSPISSIATDGALNIILSSPSNQPTDTATWTTTGISTPVKQSLGPVFTPQRAGIVLLRVKIARPSTTIYIDMKPTGFGFTSGKQYQNGAYLINEGAAGGSGGITSYGHA